MAARLLISPHQFTNLNREAKLAEEYQLDLHVAKDQAEFAALATDSELVMVTPYGKLPAEVISRMSECKGIVRYGIGYDNIDVSAAKSAGIPVSIVPDASTEEVASHAFALGLALSRRIPTGQAAIASGGWAAQVPGDLPVLSELRVGVVGMGRIGRLVAGWWKSVGAHVSAFDPVAEFDEVTRRSVDELIEQSDVLSLHVPLLAETRHMISATSIARMKRGAIVVNVSRGGLIDERALADALASGHLAGAGVDVFEQEPLPAESALRGAPNLIMTPHAAWKSKSSLDALQVGAISRARIILQGGAIPDRVA